LKKVLLPALGFPTSPDLGSDIWDLRSRVQVPF